MLTVPQRWACSTRPSVRSYRLQSLIFSFQILGYLFNWGLFGALFVQVCRSLFHVVARLLKFPDNYHVSFPHDSRTSKVVVYGVFLIELVQTFIMTRDCFITFATGFGDMESLNAMHLIWLSGPTMIGIGASLFVSFPRLSAHSQTWDSQLYGANILRLPCVRILRREEPVHCDLHGIRPFNCVVFGMLTYAVFQIALLQGSSAIAQGVQAKEIWYIPDLEARAFITCSVSRTYWSCESTILKQNHLDMASRQCYLRFDYYLLNGLPRKWDDLVLFDILSRINQLLRRDSPIPGTHTIVVKLVRLIIETGVLTGEPGIHAVSRSD